MSRSGKNLPNLIIPGAQKSGTTYLAELLGQHPDIFLPAVKEPAYFASQGDKPLGDRDGFKRQRFAYASRETYETLFEDAGDARYRVDASTDYFALEGCAELIREECGAAKIICILRQPVDRAYSAFAYHRQLGGTRAETFDEALEEEAQVMARGDVTLPQPYLGTGHYAEHVSKWQAIFGEDAVKIVLFDDLRADPKDLCDDIFQFLGLAPFEVGLEVNRNPSYGAPVGWRRHVFKAMRGEYAIFAPMAALVRALVPPALRVNLRSRMNARLAAASPSAKPQKLSSERHAELTRSFHPQIERLSAMIGRDLSHWKAS